MLGQIDAYQAPKGVDAARFATLKAELKRLIAARSDGKTISIAPGAGMNAVTDLTPAWNAQGTQVTLTWTEVLAGDYNNDGEVSIADLVPMAMFYGQRTDSGLDDGHLLVVGDTNPEITIADLQPVASNYMARLDGYQVWRGEWNGTSTDWDTVPRPNIGDPGNTAFSVNRTTSPPYDARPGYTYVDDVSGVSDKAHIRYKVGGFGDGGEGAESPAAPVPAPPLPTYSVSGTLLESGVGLAGVLMTLTPGGLNATTLADGTYTITGVTDGSYTLTPSKAGYTFVPTDRAISVSGSDATGEDFTATPPVPNSVSGTVNLSGAGGLAGVLMTLTPGGLNATTASNGTYTISDVPDGTYTLTPSKVGYRFTPATRTVVLPPAMGSSTLSPKQKVILGGPSGGNDFGAERALITKIYIQVNAVDAGQTGSPGTATVHANSQPTFTLDRVDEFDPDTSTTTTRPATAEEKADTTWTSSDPAALPMGTPNTGDQTSPGVTPDDPASSDVTADYYPSVAPQAAQTHVTADCLVSVDADPQAGYIFGFTPDSGSQDAPPNVTIWVKNYVMPVNPSDPTLPQTLVLIPAQGSTATHTYLFTLGTEPPGDGSFSATLVIPPGSDPTYPEATHKLNVNVPAALDIGAYRWRLNNNLGKGTPAVPSHPSSLNQPGTKYTIVGQGVIPSVTLPWHNAYNDEPEVWVYPADPIVRKEGDTGLDGTPVDPAWFSIFIKGQNVAGVMTNGVEWTITSTSPTGYWNPGDLGMPFQKKSPWALVTPLPGSLVPSPFGTDYDYHVVGSDGSTEISSGSIQYYDLPGPGGGFPVLTDFGYNVWGTDGLSTTPDWSTKTVSLLSQPTIFCTGKGFIPATTFQNAIVALCEDPGGNIVDYYVTAKIVKPDDPSSPSSQSWLIFTLKSNMGVNPGTYYLQVQNRLTGYQANSTIPPTPLVCEL